MSFLPPRELGWTLPLVCRLLRSLADDDALWKVHFAAHARPSPSALRSAGTWRHALMLRSTLKQAWMEPWPPGSPGSPSSTMSIPSHCTSRIRGQHEVAIRALDFDDDFVVSGGEDQLIKVWPRDGPATASPEPLFTLREHTGIVHGLAYRKGLLVSGSDDNTIKIFDRNQAFTCVHTLEGHEKGVRCLQYHDSTIVSGSYDHSVRVWDVERGVEKGILGKAHTSHAGIVFGLQYSPEESVVISVGADRCVRMFDLRTQQEAANFCTIHTHSDWHMAVAFDEQRIVVGSRDHSITVWDRHTHGLIRVLNAHSLGVVALQIDDYKIVSGSGDNTARVWPIEGSEPISCIALKDTAWCVKFDGASLFTGSGRVDSHVREFRFNAPRPPGFSQLAQPS